MIRSLTIPLFGMLHVDPAKWYGRPVGHQPTAWPWWKRFSVKGVRIAGYSPSWRSWNVWLYTRDDALCTWVCLHRTRA